MIRNILLVLLGGSCFGVLSTFVKIAYERGFSLADVTSAQAYFGAGLMWLLLIGFQLLNNRKKATRNTKEKYTSLKLILTGVASGCISISYYKSVQYLPASIAIILLMQYTWISILLERLVFKIPITLKKWLFVAVILTGTVFASGVIGAYEDLHLSLIGIGYGMVAGFFYAVFVLSNGYVGNHLPAIKKSAWVLLGVTIIIGIVFPPFHALNTLGSRGQLMNYFQEILPYGLLLGCFGMVMPPLLFAYAIPKAGVSLSTILISVEMPVAAICAHLLLKEPITIWQILGILIILSAIVFANIKNKKNTKVELAN